MARSLRGAMVAGAASLLAAAPAAAAGRVVAVAHAPEAAIAVNSQRVLWTTQTGGALSVRSSTLDGRDHQRIFRSGPLGAVSVGGNELAVSEQRLGLVVSSFSTRRHHRTTLFSGPPNGPLRRVRPRARGFQDLRVAGPLLATSSLASKGSTTIDGSGGHRVSVALPEDSVPGPLAGDLVAYDVQDLRRSAVRKWIVVRNWRTGALVRRVLVDDLETDYDLAPNGRMVLVDERGGLTLVAPSGARRRLPRARAPLSEPRFAGKVIVARQGDGVSPEHVVVVSPDTGAVRRVGPDTFEIGALATGSGAIAWLANGCVLTAPVDAPPAETVPAGRCARAEADIPSDQSQSLTTGTLGIRVQCINSPTGSCHGELRVRSERGHPVIGRQGYDIPAGRSRLLEVHVERAAARRLLRVTRRLRHSNEIAVEAEAVTVDPEGRTSKAVGPYYLAR